MLSAGDRFDSCSPKFGLEKQLCHAAVETDVEQGGAPLESSPPKCDTSLADDREKFCSSTPQEDFSQSCALENSIWKYSRCAVSDVAPNLFHGAIVMDHRTPTKKEFARVAYGYIVIAPKDSRVATYVELIKNTDGDVPVYFIDIANPRSAVLTLISKISFEDGFNIMPLIRRINATIAAKQNIVINVGHGDIGIGQVIWSQLRGSVDFLIDMFKIGNPKFELSGSWLNEIMSKDINASAYCRAFSVFDDALTSWSRQICNPLLSGVDTADTFSYYVEWQSLRVASRNENELLLTKTHLLPNAKIWSPPSGQITDVRSGRMARMFIAGAFGMNAIADRTDIDEATILSLQKLYKACEIDSYTCVESQAAKDVVERYREWAQKKEQVVPQPAR